MPRYVLRRDEPALPSLIVTSALGAAAGFLSGVVLAQKVGGLSGLARRMRDATREELELAAQAFEPEDAGGGQTRAAVVPLERKVLRAFRGDAVLRERGIEIAAIADDVIELTGWVDTAEEARHAVAVARRVRGVHTVVNRLDVESEDESARETAARFEAGDPALNEAQWEGIRVGTGPRRQGTSAEPDRHADPKVPLEDRALDARHAVREAGGELDDVAERRHREPPPERGRADGSPVAPSGVPKGDHVADAQPAAEAVEPRAPEHTDGRIPPDASP